MSDSTFKFKYPIDCNVGKYYFSTIPEQKQSNVFKLKYPVNSQFGKYYFYYDMATGKLHYVFKYWSFPKYGRYVFCYSPLENALIENKGIYLTKEDREIQCQELKKIVIKNTRTINSGIETLKNNLFFNDTNFSIVAQDEIKKLNKEKITEISIADFIGIITQETLKESIVESNEEMLYNISNGKEIKDIMDNHLLKSSNKDVLKIFSNEKELIKEANDNLILGNLEVVNDLATEFTATLREDTVLMEKMERLLQLKFEKMAKKQIYNIYNITDTGNENFNHILKKDLSEELDIINYSILNKQPKQITDIDSYKEILTKEVQGINISYSIPIAKTAKTIINLSDNINDNIGKISKEEKKAFLNDGVNLIIKAPKDIFKKHKILLSKKATKDIIAVEEIKVKKDSKSIKIYTPQNGFGNGKSSIVKDAKDITLTTDFKVKKADKKIELEKQEVLIGVEGKNISISNEDYIKKEEENIIVNDNIKPIIKEAKSIKTEKELVVDIDEDSIKIEEEILNDKEEQEIRLEVEERLNLHKRFWFLNSIGEMDIKVLPNRDYIYPASIEIFEEKPNKGVFIYKYTDQFKELGAYTVRLHQEDLTIVGQHDLIYIQDYDNTFNDIKIKAKVKELPEEEDYNYEVTFEIYIYKEGVDYVVIKQPKGFKGNKFVFVASDKFLAENHPIPLGADLGLKEIPVAIPIMVDFMNILLLLWGKRYLAFSGMTGTQAVTGMIKLVYQWLTLDTSLQEESIEDYLRCYRWMRWEAEKVYNKAKLDPNLTGNLWIEEVIYEMIDYLEMHHFNKMPEWDKTTRLMDEHRNIFNDPHLDIPIVLDKFKGIRKRVINKNKRLND